MRTKHSIVLYTIILLGTAVISVEAAERRQETCIGRLCRALGLRRQPAQLVPVVPAGGVAQAQGAAGVGAIHAPALHVPAAHAPARIGGAAVVDSDEDSPRTRAALQNLMEEARDERHRLDNASSTTASSSRSQG